MASARSFKGYLGRCKTFWGQKQKGEGHTFFAFFVCNSLSTQENSCGTPSWVEKPPRLFDSVHFSLAVTRRSTCGRWILCGVYRLSLDGAGSEPPPSKVPFKGGLKGPFPGGGTKVRRAWSPLEAPLKPFSPPWSPSQAPLKPSPLQAPLKPPSPWSPLQALLKPPWSPLEALLKPPWSHLQALLKPPWSPLEALLKPPWSHLERVSSPASLLQALLKPPSSPLEARPSPSQRALLCKNFCATTSVP